MADETELLEQAPLQDRDLLLRMSNYFDCLEMRLRRGQGWFIFNAGSARAERITTFINRRLAEADRGIDHVLVPWRDFALSAYVTEVGMSELGPTPAGTFPTNEAKHGYELAKHLTEETRERLVFSDLLVLVGLRPSYWHEATFLDRMLDERSRNRLATILMTPEMPTELEASFRSLDPTRTFWPRLFQRMYESSLVAL